MKTILLLLVFIAVEYFTFSSHPILSFTLFLGAVIFSLMNGGYDYLRIMALTLPRDSILIWYGIRLMLTIVRYLRQKHTIVTLFEETAQRYLKKVAIVYEQVEWTFADLSLYSNALAHYLSSYDDCSPLKKGDVVAVFMSQRPEFVAAWLGICKTGSIAALLNFHQRERVLLHSIQVSDTKAIICGEELLPHLVKIVDQFEKPIPILVVPMAEGPPSSAKIAKTDYGKYKSIGFSTLKPLLKLGVFKGPPGALSDIALYLFTSGTTGLPKPAKISNTRIVAMTSSFKYFTNFTPDDTVYVFLPIYHSNGGILGIGQCLLYGSRVLLKPRFSASNFWNDCVEYNCKAFLYIGEICRYLLAQPVSPMESQHCVEYAFGNGLRPSVWKNFQSRFSIKHIVEFYGSTEGNANALNFTGQVGAVGFSSRIVKRAYPAFLIKVDKETDSPLRDPETGLCIECEPEEEGELVGRIGPLISRFEGYTQKSETDRKVIHDVRRRGDSCFRSGDILVMDELGFFYFRDRTGDTFRWRGENVSTQEVEAILSSVIGLRDVAVYGVEIADMEGRAGMAAIGDPNRNSDEIIGNLAEKLSKSLPSYSLPVFLRIAESLPKTETFKFVKRNLQKEGFNPESVGKDLLFYLNTSSRPNEYAPLTKDVYESIINGNIRM